MKKCSLLCLLFMPILLYAPTRQELIDAIQQGDMKKFNTILKTTEDKQLKDMLNAQTDLDKSTPLHHAVAQKGNQEIIIQLINKGANINLKDNKGLRPFDIAKQTGYDHKTMRYLDGSNPLHWAIYDRDMNSFINRMEKYRSRINEQDFQGDTPLHLAALWGEKGLEFVKVLLNNNASHTIQNFEGKTPLHIAVDQKYNKDMIFEFYVHGANIDIKDKNGLRPYDIAKQLEYKYQVLQLLDNSNPLHRHIYSQNFGELQKAINYYKNRGDLHDAINQQTFDGDTPLYLAAIIDDARDAKFTQELLKYGANPKIKNNDGYTPLHQASSERKPAIVKTLIEHGADVNATSNNGDTPLVIAIKNYKDRKLHLGTIEKMRAQEVVQQLIEHGTDLDTKIKSFNGMTPLEYVQKQPELADLVDLLMPKLAVDIDKDLDKLAHEFLALHAVI